MSGSSKPSKQSQSKAQSFDTIKALTSRKSNPNASNAESDRFHNWLGEIPEEAPFDKLTSNEMFLQNEPSSKVSLQIPDFELADKSDVCYQE